MTSPEISARVDSVDEVRLRRDVEALAGSGPRPGFDSAAIDRVLDLMTDVLREAGHTATRETFESDTTVWGWATDGSRTRHTEQREHVNLVVEIPGATHPERIFEIGAHYDTVRDSPGADDNASAVAGLLEIARALRGIRCERTLRFLFFAQEEDGLDGSRAHVAALEAPIDGFISLEMIGYTTTEPNSQKAPLRIPVLLSPPRVGDFVAVVGNIPSGWIGNAWEKAADRYVPDLKWYSLNRLGGFFGDAARSDHKPYWDAGIHAMMLTDTANFRNPHYHKASDTPDTLDYVFLRRVTQATVAMALEWARPLPSPSPAPTK